MLNLWATMFIPAVVAGGVSFGIVITLSRRFGSQRPLLPVERRWIFGYGGVMGFAAGWWMWWLLR